MSDPHSDSGTGSNPTTGAKGNDNHPFSITIVVGGEDQKLEVKPDDIARDVLEKALQKSKNIGQPVDDWELKTEAGLPLLLTATLAQLNVGKDETLFASLKAGAAG
jgi:hypothetical protein